jgi:hypothetical protein
MVKRTPMWVSFVPAILFALLLGCGGDDDGGDGDTPERKGKPVAGTFVGRVPETEAFVSVVASPPAKGEDKREVTVFVCDARRVCEWYSGSATGNRYTATSAGGEAQARGRLSGKEAAGSVELPTGDRVSYKAGPAQAVAGLYDLTVNANGRLRGASASGVGLTGQSSLPEPGSGTVKLADGKRIKFVVVRSSEDVRLGADRARVIVLPDYKLKGAAKSGSDSTFFVRSSPK